MATRERIVAVAKELGYQKNYLARGLRSGKSYTVGAVVGYATAFWNEVLAGAQSVLAAQDYHLLLDYAPDAARQEDLQIEALRAKQVDGLLIAPSDTDPENSADLPAAYYRALEAEGVPFVFVDRFVPGLDAADYVIADNFAAAGQAVHHLAGLGHRRIAYLYAPRRMSTAQQERQNGYESAMRARNLLPLWWKVTTPGADRRHEGFETVRDRLAAPGASNVSAVLAATDSMAMGALRACHDARRSVPADIAVMGFGGADVGAYLEPPLSTIALPRRALGEGAARLLLGRLEGGESPPQHLVLPTQLVVRASCGGTPAAPPNLGARGGKNFGGPVS